MRVMGIDPGSICTGYGIVEDTDRRLGAVAWGGVRCGSGKTFSARLVIIYDRLMELIREHRPDAVAVEDLFFATNPKSTLKLGQARGVALLAAAHSKKEIREYSPLEVKQSVAGYGRAGKDQVRRMVATLLRMEKGPEPHDAADALAIAICHLHSSATEARLRAGS